MNDFNFAIIIVLVLLVLNNPKDDPIVIPKPNNEFSVNEYHMFDFDARTRFELADLKIEAKNEYNCEFCLDTGLITTGDKIFSKKCNHCDINSNGSIFPTGQLKESEPEEVMQENEWYLDHHPRQTLYFIHTDWCGPCILMNKNVLPELVKSGFVISSQDSIATSPHIIKLNLEKNSNFIKLKFGILPEEVPTCIIYDEVNDRIKNTSSGYMDHIKLANYYNKYVTK